MFDSQKIWGKMQERERKKSGKLEGKKMKIKNRFEVNKLFLYAT